MTRIRQQLNLEALEDRRLLATCHVVRLGDFGAGGDLGGGHSRGDLRYCITKANDNPGHDAIAIEANGIINLSGVLPGISDDVVILGPGADKLTIRRDTGGNYRIFEVLPNVHAEIYDVSIANGIATGMSANMGGGIRNSGVLTLGRCTVNDNMATISFAMGGGIANLGVLTVFDSTITGNAASGNGGLGGGIFNSSTAMLTIINSTISGNSASAGGPGDNSARGGGIRNSNQQPLIIITSTITDNDVDNSGLGPESGGGIDGNVTWIRNSLIAGNSGRSGPDVFGSLTSGGYNLFGDSSGGSGYDPADILNVNPMLGPLQDNGGPTLTHALLPGSPSIDAGDNADAPEWDQRGPGFPRIVNGRIDIGAFEVQATGAPPANDLTALITADLETIKAKRRR
jgi:hypothetical protein